MGNSNALGVVTAEAGGGQLGDCDLGRWADGDPVSGEPESLPAMLQGEATLLSPACPFSWPIRSGNKGAPFAAVTSDLPHSRCGEAEGQGAPRRTGKLFVDKSPL